jgi:hypothetical protein
MAQCFPPRFGVSKTKDTSGTVAWTNDRKFALLSSKLYKSGSVWDLVRGVRIDQQ